MSAGYTPGPGESRRVNLSADPRLIARFHGEAGRWHIREGTYKVALGKAADALDLTAETTLRETRFGT
jgi:beta-glucosidase